MGTTKERKKTDTPLPTKFVENSNLKAPRLTEDRTYSYEGVSTAKGVASLRWRNPPDHMPCLVGRFQLIGEVVGDKIGPVGKKQLPCLSARNTNLEASWFTNDRTYPMRAQSVEKWYSKYAMVKPSHIASNVPLLIRRQSFGIENGTDETSLRQFQIGRKHEPRSSQMLTDNHMRAHYVEWTGRVCGIESLAHECARVGFIAEVFEEK